MRVPDALQESSLQNCPVCNKHFHRVVLPYHISSCLDGGVVKSSRTPAPPQPSAQSLPEPSRPASESTTPPSQPGNSAIHHRPAARPGANAFAHMMQSQREQSQMWSFFLGRRPDGAYFWHMWRDSLTGRGMAFSDQPVPLPYPYSLMASLCCTCFSCLQLNGNLI